MRASRLFAKTVPAGTYIPFVRHREDCSSVTTWPPASNPCPLGSLSVVRLMAFATRVSLYGASPLVRPSRLIDAIASRVSSVGFA